MKKIQQSVELFLRKSGLEEQLNKRYYLSLWYRVVGKQIARHTMPLAVKDNKLLVEVTDSTWLFHLTMLKSRIIEDFNAAAGFLAISDLKFFNADFHSRTSEEKAAAFKKKEDLYEEEKEMVMEPEEEENLSQAVLLSPASFQPLLRRFLQKSYIYQKQQGKRSQSNSRKGE